MYLCRYVNFSRDAWQKIYMQRRPAHLVTRAVRNNHGLGQFNQFSKCKVLLAHCSTVAISLQQYWTLTICTMFTPNCQACNGAETSPQSIWCTVPTSGVAVRHHMIGWNICVQRQALRGFLSSASYLPSHELFILVQKSTLYYSDTVNACIYENV